ncbi:MAG: 3-dehydroquinate synthase [Acidobacteria bacterium]|nr:3-dehydroquinate synthase [Acidobacteriota bacterium]
MVSSSHLSSTDAGGEVVRVPLGDRSYDIVIAAGILDRIGELTRQALGGKVERVVVISNPLVDGHYGRRITKSLRAAGFRPLSLLIGDGERAKSLRTAERVWDFLISHRIERSEGLIALGGGVVGDLAGFVAATYQRGMPFVQVPTTLLAQIDSSVGGKTAVNRPLGKNLVGAFHQPAGVIIDPLVLRTLPPREFSAGMYEALKYGIIRDREFAAFLDGSLDQIRQLAPAPLTRLIARCCEIKAEVVAADEREGGLRRILNYGHTVGHALEAVTRYRRLRHGEAVGYGMICAANLAAAFGLLAASEAELIRERIDAIGRRPAISDLDVAAILAAMAHDKKVAHGRLPFILPTSIGEVVVRDDLPPSLIRGTVRDLLR